MQHSSDDEREQAAGMLMGPLGRGLEGLEGLEGLDALKGGGGNSSKPAVDASPQPPRVHVYADSSGPPGADPHADGAAAYDGAAEVEALERELALQEALLQQELALLLRQQQQQEEEEMAAPAAAAQHAERVTADAASVPASAAQAAGAATSNTCCTPIGVAPLAAPPGPLEVQLRQLVTPSAAAAAEAAATASQGGPSQPCVPLSALSTPAQSHYGTPRGTVLLPGPSSSPGPCPGPGRAILARDATGGRVGGGIFTPPLPKSPAPWPLPSGPPRLQSRGLDIGATGKGPTAARPATAPAGRRSGHSAGDEPAVAAAAAAQGDSLADWEAEQLRLWRRQQLEQAIMQPGVLATAPPAEPSALLYLCPPSQQQQQLEQDQMLQWRDNAARESVATVRQQPAGTTSDQDERSGLRRMSSAMRRLLALQLPQRPAAAEGGGRGRGRWVQR